MKRAEPNRKEKKVTISFVVRIQSLFFSSTLFFRIVVLILQLLDLTIISIAPSCNIPPMVKVIKMYVTNAVLSIYVYISNITPILFFLEKKLKTPQYESLLEVIDKGELSVSQKRGIITLLHIIGNDRKQLNTILSNKRNVKSLELGISQYSEIVHYRYMQHFKACPIA